MKSIKAWKEEEQKYKVLQFSPLINPLITVGM